MIPTVIFLYKVARYLHLIIQFLLSKMKKELLFSYVCLYIKHTNREILLLSAHIMTTADSNIQTRHNMRIQTA